ncbi:beta-ketoacyl-[acyl-carrier-protein] synthase family protein [Rhodococcus sp. H29-C3]|uniref:beta-ketoacyl-[acyl-carrier-protein] synthase family protein n=1 Tax=Rhodococcus sp. H29-C3 TaxID=3046307 RepID=UPI0024B88C1B|nr:beta-ketoacyl-[acyl-carrier-protein] synthase family protein [Rhodococcus sp. H29-C3]MDJ0362345.1 beta-ketoacyl-[acyl-carrier-protein] synthase family protein [Rhodococcus sp. H29-C3]
MSRRVVITGIGVVAPGSVGREPFWTMLTEGRTATRTTSLCDPAPFRSRVSAECDFDPSAEGLCDRQVAELDRAAQMALVASREAVADAQWGGSYAPGRTGVILGSAVGATMNLEMIYRQLSDDGRLWHVNAPGPSHLYSQFIPSSFVSTLAAEHHAEGPSTLVSTGCTSGVDAVGTAFEMIQDGYIDSAIAGATEAPIAPITIACFDAIRATSTYNDDPSTASRPFDASRGGFVLGEGSAVFVLESLETALARDARIYAELRGYASKCNAFHMTGLRSDGNELAGAVIAAMRQAAIESSAIDYVNAHGSGTKQNDLHETNALKKALGEHAYQVPISSIKSMIGHSLGAIGSLEIAACALAIRDNIVPPTANLTAPDPELDLDYVPVHARQHQTETALTTASGFGGFQSAMVLSSMEASS